MDHRPLAGSNGNVLCPLCLMLLALSMTRSAGSVVDPEGGGQDDRPSLASVLRQDTDVLSKNCAAGDDAREGWIFRPFLLVIFFTRAGGARPSGRLRRSLARCARSGPAKKSYPVAGGRQKLCFFQTNERRDLPASRKVDSDPCFSDPSFSWTEVLLVPDKRKAGHARLKKSRL